MPRRRDPNFTTGHLCRFCGQLIPWGTILRIIRTDPDTPGYMLNETAAHTECLRAVLRAEVELTFPRHWNGRAPCLDDDEDIYVPIPTPLQGRGCSAAARPEATAAWRAETLEGEGEQRQIRPCALCAKAIAPATLVRLRVQKPAGPVKRPEFDEQSFPVHFDCLAKVSTMRFG